MGNRLERLDSWALASVGAGLFLVAALVAVGGSTSEYAWLQGLARGIMVCAPLAVGVYAWRRPSGERFGMLLVVAAIGTFLTTLAESRDPLLYSIGRLAGWVLEIWLVYLVLAFPSGRLAGRADRLLVQATALLVLVLYLPSALLTEQYPVPAPWTSCDSDCPANAFMVTHSEPALIEDLVRPLRELLTIALITAVAVRLAQRHGGASRLTRRTQGALLGVACVRLVGYAAAILGRRYWPESDVVAASAWLVALTIPMLAGAYLVGVARWRLFIAGALQRLATSLRAHPPPEDLRAALADAFEDPRLEIAYWLGGTDGGWADVEGHPIRPPPPTSGRCVTEVSDGGKPVAAIIHDCALRDDQTFVDSAASYAIMTLDNHRLSAEAASLIREVNASRARIQQSADAERRRIERDLHDGAQQRLVALRVKLELSAEKLGGGASARLLRHLGGEVDTALDELRALAHGIYPSPLADRGIVEALRSAALQAALPTAVLATGLRKRYPRETDSTVYFACLEALQNAEKHARGATAVVVELSEHRGRLRLEVRDDGDGFDPAMTTAGAGLTGMRDRFAAVAGEVAVVSSPGRGTRVIGEIPLVETAPDPPAPRFPPASGASRHSRA